LLFSSSSSVLSPVSITSSSLCPDFIIAISFAAVAATGTISMPVSLRNGS
jgi:hypothetical protein